MAPHLIVQANNAPRHKRPSGASPILNLKIGYPVETEGRAKRRSDWSPVVVLQSEDVNFIDGFAAVEINLHPIRIRIGGGIVPTAAGGPT